MLEATRTINAQRSERIVALVERAVGPLEGQPVAVLGLAFKPDTDDIRDSPGIALTQALLAKGAQVRAWDALAAPAAAAALGDRVAVGDDLAAALRGAALAVVATAWPQLATLDWAWACGLMAQPRVFDGRDVVPPDALPAGAELFTVGTAPAGRTARG